MQRVTRRAHDLRKCFELLRLLQSLGERLHRLGLCELRGRGLGQPHFPGGAIHNAGKREGEEGDDFRRLVGAVYRLRPRA